MREKFRMLRRSTNESFLLHTHPTYSGVALISMASPIIPDAGKQTGPKRTSSSAQQPLPGIDLPDRLLRRQAAPDAPPLRSKKWSAQLRLVKQCKAAEYKDGLDMTHVWSFDDTSRARCNLHCEGDEMGMKISIVSTTYPKDPEPKEHGCLEIPGDKSIVLRLYETVRSVEFETNYGSSAGFGRTVWQVFFREEGRLVKDAKALIVRLHNKTMDMPKDWFSYRNYAQRHSTNEDDNVLVQEFAGGYKWTFGGFMASPQFKHAIGRLTDEQYAEMRDKEAVEGHAGATVTRRARETQSAELVELKGKRSAKAQRQAQAQEEAQARKEAKAQKKSDKLERRAAERRRRAARPATPEEEEEEEDPSDPGADAGNDGAESPAESDKFVVERLENVRQNDGNTEFLVSWEGYPASDNSWEPATAVHHDSMRDFFERGRGGRGRGSGRGSRGRGGASGPR